MCQVCVTRIYRQNRDGIIYFEQHGMNGTTSQSAKGAYVMNMADVSRIDALFDTWRMDGAPGGQVLIKKDGKTLYEKCFGNANVELSVPITPDTRFNIASNSKQFTVTAVLMLMEEGLISPSDDIRRYIPELVSFSEPVSVHQLMTHTSGIRDVVELLVQSGRRMDDTVKQEDALKLISMQKGLCFKPGTRYMYSNSNFVCLATIAEKLSGKPLPLFLQERVFAPLHMDDTLVEDRYWILVPNASASYYDNGRAFVHSVFNSGFYGDGNIWTTARDFSKWLEGQYMTPSLLDSKTVDFMRTLPAQPADTFYACGLVLGNVAGHRIITHGGTDACFRSQFGLLPDDGIEIIVFSNTNNLSPEDIVTHIAMIMLGEDEAADALPEPTLARVPSADAPGFYYGTGADQMLVAEVYENDGALYLRDNYDGVALFHETGNLYHAGRSALYLCLGDAPHLTWLGESIDAKKAPAAVDEAAVGEYLGEYESEELLDVRYEVCCERGKLSFRHKRLGDMFMAPLEEKDTFILDMHLDNAMILRFLRDGRGAVYGFDLSGGDCRGIRFARVQ